MYYLLDQYVREVMTEKRTTPLQSQHKPHWKKQRQIAYKL